MKIKVLVASVGGSPEPLVVSLRTHQPERVWFIASESSQEQVAEVIRRSGFEGPVEIISVPDPNDLRACLDRAMTCGARASEAGGRVIVDYTGGTKTMAVALGLMGVRYGFALSYVGGGTRTKEGVGAVVDGAEEVRVVETEGRGAREMGNKGDG